MRLSTINISLVMLEGKIFENPKPYIIFEELIIPKEIIIIAKSGQGELCMRYTYKFLY